VAQLKFLKNSPRRNNLAPQGLNTPWFQTILAFPPSESSFDSFWVAVGYPHHSVAFPNFLFHRQLRSLYLSMLRFPKFPPPFFRISGPSSLFSFFSRIFVGPSSGRIRFPPHVVASLRSPHLLFFLSRPSLLLLLALFIPPPGWDFFSRTQRVWTSLKIAPLFYLPSSGFLLYPLLISLLLFLPLSVLVTTGTCPSHP